MALIRDDSQVPALWLSAALFILFGKAWLASASGNTALTLFLFVWLFGAILWGAFGVVRHAEHLAAKLGEPYGTLILTLSVTVIEVAFIITAVFSGAPNSPVARDAVFAVFMIMINGVVGLCLLLGGLRHHEQNYNLPGARAFLAVLVPLAVFALVLPNFTQTPGPILSAGQAISIGALTLALYGVFLSMQTARYSGFFKDPDGDDKDAHDHVSARSVGFHAGALLVTLLPAVFLTEELGHIVERAVSATGAPIALVGVIVAVLVLAPESMGALQAALRNKLQRSVNIALGSVLATIGLTIPGVLLVGGLLGKPIVLGLGPREMLLLASTLLVASLTFGGERTNMLQGVVHLVMFLVFVVLMFAP
ncbi:MAG: calcium:proton antiporter [Pseudolabrys sp.]|nr:calcium:proton antiporter [Pseudolabrys sp.]MBV9954360.1 calcium:proton antiporter [Pseudolabrys sp.]